MPVNSVSYENRRATSPSQSLHARNFSAIHAASPSGESLSATASVSGFVMWTCAYPPSSAAQSPRCFRNACSSSVSGRAASIGGS